VDSQKLYDEALEQWGMDSQKLMLVEECLELALNIVKTYRADCQITREDIAEEIADVRIMIEQVEQAMELDDLTSHSYVYKLRRLETRLFPPKVDMEGAIEIDPKDKFVLEEFNVSKEDLSE